MELDQLATALSAAQGEFEAVAKTETNPFFKSKYAGLPDVIRTASPILAKHGLAVCQMIEGDAAGGDCLTTILMHKSGQHISGTMRLHLTKDDPQGQGSAVTYARRYAYMAALGLVADEDDDGNAASGKAGMERIRAGTRRRPAPVTEISPKRRLLQACAGDKDMAERLWQEATHGGTSLQTETELLLLLSRAEAEVNAGDGRPM